MHIFKEKPTLYYLPSQVYWPLEKTKMMREAVK